MNPAEKLTSRFPLFEVSAHPHLVGAGEDRRRDVRLSAFAVFRLTTSSNFVGCSIGSSAGLAQAVQLGRGAGLIVGQVRGHDPNMVPAETGAADLAQQIVVGPGQELHLGDQLLISYSASNAP